MNSQRGFEKDLKLLLKQNTSRCGFIALLIVSMMLSSIITAASFATLVPAAKAQGSQRYTGPAVSGIFDSASDFVSDAPGVGAVTRVTCTNGSVLGSGSFPNIRINCDSTKLPHNEVSIAADPTNPNHLVAGSNDYELFFVGSFVVERIIAGYYTSFDAGTTWLNGHVDPGGFTFSGDPAVAFNAKLGLVHYGTIAFNSGQGGGFATATIEVNTSNDGGKTFGHPVIVALGTGGTRVTVFNDKPYITVDNSPTSPTFGRLYVTYTRFLFDQFGRYVESPIFMAFSDDGGGTFSTPKMISGSSSTLCANPFNSFNAGICNEDQFSTPVVGRDGTLYVAYENDELQGAPEFRDQYLVVRSTDGGQTFQGPFQAVGPIFDGADEYPINVNGRQTLTNSQFRVNSAGNLAVDSSSGPGPSSTRLYVSFSDNRNGGLTGSFTTVTTNTDVFVVASANGGSSWSSPTPVLTGSASQHDQFYPWAAVDRSNGNVEVAFSDRSYDPANVKYGETLATSTDHAATFIAPASHLDTGLSNPNDSRFFTNGGQTNGKATFLGDYNGLAIASNGAAHAIWTDMRTSAFPNPPPGRGHNTQDIVTADPGSIIIEMPPSTVSFDGVTVTTSSMFTVNTAARTLAGTASVTVTNSTSGQVIVSNNITIALAFGTSLSLQFVLSVPSGSLSLGISCQVDVVSHTASCTVSRDPDLNHDGRIDIVDVATVAFSFDSVAGSSRFNAAADLNADGRVDITDVATVAFDFGLPVFA